MDSLRKQGVKQLILIKNLAQKRGLKTKGAI